MGWERFKERDREDGDTGLRLGLGNSVGVGEILSRWIDRVSIILFMSMKR